MVGVYVNRVLCVKLPTRPPAVVVMWWLCWKEEHSLCCFVMRSRVHRVSMKQRFACRILTPQLGYTKKQATSLVRGINILRQNRDGRVRTRSVGCEG